MIAIDPADESLRQAHEIAHKAEYPIKTQIENVFDVAIHIEPW
jgi:divalent metal cation (Fe/Co/Zn/Cd) transporter